MGHLVEFVCLALSAANSVNFSTQVLRAAKGRPEKLKTNCGLKATPGLANSSPLDREWVTKGVSIAAISGEPTWIDSTVGLLLTTSDRGDLDPCADAKAWHLDQQRAWHLQTHHLAVDRLYRLCCAQWTC